MKIAVLFQKSSYRGRLLLHALAEDTDHEILGLYEDKGIAPPKGSPVTDFLFKMVVRGLAQYKQLRNYRPAVVETSMPELKCLSQKNRLSLVRMENFNSDTTQKALQAFEPDLICLCGAGKYIKPNIFGQARIAALNLHSSLLPKYRGVAPFWTLFHDDEMGVTVHVVDEKFDAGEIVAQEKVDVSPLDDIAAVATKADHVGISLFTSVIEAYDNQTVETQPNPPSPYYGRPSPMQYLSLWLRLIHRNLDARKRQDGQETASSIRSNQ